MEQTPQEMLALWLKKDWPLNDAGKHANTQMSLVTATMFCRALNDHGIDSSLKKDFHFGNPDRPYYEVAITSADRQKILSSEAIKEALCAKLKEYSPQANIHYLNALFAGGDWQYDSEEEKYYPTEKLPNAVRVVNILEAHLEDAIWALGDGESRSTHIPESALLRIYDDVDLETSIRDAGSRENGALARLAAERSGKGKESMRG